MTTTTTTQTDDPALRCTIGGCNAETYLVISSCIPLYRVNPPWPGAGPEDYTPAAAVTQGWEVECTEGHTIWSHADQIRVDNASGLTDDDTTTDFAPTFRLAALLGAQSVAQRIAADPEIHLVVLGTALRRWEDCEQPTQGGQGRCIEPAVAIKVESGRALQVCHVHATPTLGGDSLIVSRAEAEALIGPWSTR